MKKETLTIGIDLSNKIIKQGATVESLKLEIGAIEKSYYGTFKAEGKMTYRLVSETSERHMNISIGIPNDIIIELLNKKLYIAENLLKKYTLEFNNL